MAPDREPGWAIRELEARVDAPEDAAPSPSMVSVVILQLVALAAIAMLVSLPVCGGLQ